MSKKIVIIGAGPVGCYTAQLLKAFGYSHLLIEEHAEIGRPLHCTGLVGAKVFEEKRPYLISTGSVTNVINGAVIHHNGHSFAIERKRVAYVIDRERFDKDLSTGLDILFQNRFIGLEKNGGGYTVSTDKERLSADIVIGADGVNSLVRRILNPEGAVKIFKGLQLRVKTKLRHKDLVEVYLKKPSFLWVVPESEDVVRVGTISENPNKDLEEFLKETKLKGRILERFGGLVSTGICSSTVLDNIAIVGDAAFQMKPLSYGGIYFGLRAATVLAGCIKAGRINDYDALWKKELASEIKIGLKVKGMYDRLNDRELNKIFILLKQQKNFLERIGDFENHSRIILELLKKPALYPQLGELFTMLFRKSL